MALYPLSSPSGRLVATLTGIALLCVSVLAFVFVFQRGQDQNWDLLNYHYYTGHALISGRYAVDVAAAGLQSFLHPATNVMAYLALRYLPFPFSAWSILLVQLASLPLLWMIGNLLKTELGYQKASFCQLLALLLCLVAPLWWSELGTSFFSSWITPLILLGLYALLRGLRDGPRSRFILLAGICLGLATGLKLTNAPFALGALAALVLALRRDGLPTLLRAVLWLAVGGMLGFLLTAWWYWYLWQEWQNPLFPLYNAVFASPYYDLHNYRDVRWKFFSFSEFLAYFWQVTVGTVKTSEIAFTDIRIPLAALLGLATLAIPGKLRLGRGALALLAFVAVSFALWAALFAYQRYLIPVEVLLGFCLWILLARLCRRESLRVVLLLGMLGVSLAWVKVPDWGHGPVNANGLRPFSLNLPDKLRNTPAQYLVHGAPISYLLPFLDQDSVFYGLNFSRQSKALIAQRLQENTQLPVRMLLEESGLTQAWRTLRYFGYTREQHSLDCSYFSNSVSRYVACDIIARQDLKPDENGVLVRVALANSDFHRSRNVLALEAFFPSESWGRWAPLGYSTVNLAGCLPPGDYLLRISGLAAPTSAGATVEFALGTSTAGARFTTDVTTQDVTLSNTQACVDRLVLNVSASREEKTRSAESGTPQRGLAIVNLEVIKK